MHDHPTGSVYEQLDNILASHAVQNELPNKAPKRPRDRRNRSLRWSYELLHNARTSSRQRGHEIPSITEEWIKAQYVKQGGRCYWTGHFMDTKAPKRGSTKPSLDRLDRNRGYHPDNVVLTIWAANRVRGSIDWDLFKSLFKEPQAVPRIDGGVECNRFAAAVHQIVVDQPSCIPYYHAVGCLKFRPSRKGSDAGRWYLYIRAKGWKPETIPIEGVALRSDRAQAEVLVELIQEQRRKRRV